MTTYSHFFDYVVVVESLRPGDPKTGADLYDLVIRPRCDAKGLKHCFKTPRSGVAFLEFLTELAHDCAANHHSPILHIECHGSEDGLEIAGDFVGWVDLKPCLLALNTVSRLNLLVSLAACSGAALVKVVDVRDRAPVCGMLGPNATSADPSVLLRDYSAFFSEFLSTFSGRDALIAMNGGPPSKTWRYAFTPVLWFFKEVYRHYVRTLANPAALKRRARKIAQKTTRASRLPPASHPAARWAAAQLADQKRFFEEFRSHFFMYDLFPQNQERFPVSFADVSAVGAAR